MICQGHSKNTWNKKESYWLDDTLGSMSTKQGTLITAAAVPTWPNLSGNYNKTHLCWDCSGNFAESLLTSNLYNKCDISKYKNKQTDVTIGSSSIWKNWSIKTVVKKPMLMVWKRKNITTSV